MMKFEFACQPDCLSKMTPPDLRIILANRDILLKLSEAFLKKMEFDSHSGRLWDPDKHAAAEKDVIAILTACKVISSQGELNSKVVQTGSPGTLCS